MMKLRILNMNGFLDVVNACRGAVYVVAAGGQKRDIRGNAVFQRYLLGEHRRGGGSLFSLYLPRRGPEETPEAGRPCPGPQIMERG